MAEQEPSTFLFALQLAVAPPFEPVQDQDQMVPVHDTEGVAKVTEHRLVDGAV